MKNRIVFSVLGCLTALSITPLAAQEREDHVFTANVGGGLVMPAYGTGTRHDTGFNLTAGAGVNIKHFGLLGEFMFNQMGINSTTLKSLQFPGGDTRIWAVTANPVIRFAPRGPVDFYLLGGPGVYHRHVEFTKPSVATFTGFDPFFGVFFPVAVPTNQVLLEYSTTKLGVNGGGGFNFRVGRNAKFYAEARYHQMYTRRITSFVPVTVGFRW